MKAGKVTFWALLAFCLSYSVSAAEAGPVNAKDGLALSGYDAVSYFEDGGPLQGSSDFVAAVGGADYRFATAENRDRFLSDPDAYLPTCGGWCAWAMLDGEKVEVDPLSYRIFEGQLLLFYNGFWADTRKRWEKRAKEEGEEKLVRIVLENWEKQ